MRLLVGKQFFKLMGLILGDSHRALIILWGVFYESLFSIVAEDDA